MKRVLCVVSSLNAGGAETFLMKVFRELDKTNYIFDFIVSADGIYDEEVTGLGGKIYKVSLRTQKPIKVFSEIKKIVKENNYKYFLKLTDTPLGGILDILAAKAGGAKHISVRSCNAVSTFPLYKEFIFSIIRPFFNTLVDCKIAPSDKAGIYTFGTKQVKKNRVNFVNNGLDLNVFFYNDIYRKEIRNEFNILDNSILVGHVGRFTAQKNHEYLLKVFDELYKLNENTYLLLVGIGELETTIKNLASTLKCKNNIIFAGLRRDVPKLLSAMDVFVLPSFYEGMPNVVIEAQASGLPCIISDTITKEANITGLVQYLSIENNPVEWAKAVLAKSNSLRKDTKEDFVKNGYDIISVANKLTQLLFQEY